MAEGATIIDAGDATAENRRAYPEMFTDDRSVIGPPLGGSRQFGGNFLNDLPRPTRPEETGKEFVAVVAHEMRSPITVFQGYLEILLGSSYSSLPEHGKALRAMRRQSERLNSLVNDLLTLSQFTDLRLRQSDIPITTFFTRLREDRKPQFRKKNCALRFFVPPDLPPVRADQFRLEQVFSNLLDNALKYSAAGGKVTVGALPGENKNTVNFYVRDTGPGIPGDKIDLIFDKFFRLNHDHEGFGLGLSIVKHLVQLHGGRVWAESELGKGTTVRFSLPV